MVRSEYAALQTISISKINGKMMLILFFYNKGVIHHEYVPEGQTVNAMFYIQILLLV